MLNLEKHPYFKEYIDPESGVKSYFLTEKVGALQQHFYFSECSLTDDGKYLWIRVSNPPAQFLHLAVVSMDPDNPFIRSFPAAGTAKGGCKAIFPGTTDAIFAEDSAIYRVTVEGKITKILELDPDFVKNRVVRRMFTHASISCDKKYIVLDMCIADIWYIGLGNLETGEVTILDSAGRCYDHAQFSPNKPDLFLIDQDWWRDWHSGEYMPIHNRIWLMNTEGTMFEPLLPQAWYGRDGSEICHDFWSKDGKLCWIDYRYGAFECDVDTREITHVWKRPTCHAHTTFDRQFWCADQTPYNWAKEPCKVLFYDRKTNKEIDIFSALPNPKTKRGGIYHLDPHPAFTTDDKYIISTVTLLDGSADVAITPVEPLIELCREKGTPVGE